MIFGRLKALGLLILLTACGGPTESVWAPDSALRKYAYAPNTPPEIRLYTVVSKRSGSGAHSGLLITTQTERILFDPAGTFSLPFAPERNDVHYGITPGVLAIYIDYHARRTYDVVEQRLSVSAVQAAKIAELAKAYGPVPRAQCSVSITRILQQAPGFETMRVTYFPNRSREAFGALPGVRLRVYSDSDPDRNEDVLTNARLQ